MVRRRGSLRGFGWFCEFFWLIPTLWDARRDGLIRCRFFSNSMMILPFSFFSCDSWIGRMCFDYDYVPYIRRNIPGYNLDTFSDVLTSLLFDAASAATNCQVWCYLKPHQDMTIESTELPPFQLAKHHILPLAPHVNSNTQKLDTCMHVRVRVGVLLDPCTTSVHWPED